MESPAPCGGFCFWHNEILNCLIKGTNSFGNTTCRWLSRFGNTVSNSVNGFQYYRGFRLLAPLLLGGYLAIALLKPPAGFPETFPFFNWSLFPNAPGSITSRVEIFVRSVDGQALEPPRYYFDLGSAFRAAQQRNVTVSKLARQLVRAHHAGDMKSVRALRNVLEATYMAEAGTVEYALVTVVYDPLERVQTGRIRSARTMVEFRKELGD